MNRELKSLLVLMIWNIFTDISVLATGNPVNGSADQSSQYNNCSADKALDGVKIFSIPDEHLPTCTCSVTGVKSFPRWWEMDFGSMHLVGLIIVTGRSDVNEQSTNLTAFISNNTKETNKSTQVNLLDETTIGLHVRLDPPRIAQYINIKKEDTIDVMTICEVEVFETNCTMGYFGDKCLRRCHCQSPCDVLTGNCNECEPGWYPPTCETACSQGYYGQNCSKECSHNCEDNNCNSQNGSCVQGCTPGYDYTMSTNCSVATGTPVNGSADQSSQYKNCSADKALDGVKIFSIPDEHLPTCTCSVTGVKSFPRWWEMDFGSMHLVGLIIVTGRSDVNVQSTNLTTFISNNTMETNNGTQVNSPDETTVGLHVRLDPPRIAQYINIKKEDTNDVMTICEIEVFETNCTMGYFGDKCLRRCHCQSQCDVLTGNCNECEPGWYPPTCETDCPTGSYGEKCSSNCSQHCIAEDCNHVNGICNLGCKPGYDFLIDHKCTTPCSQGYYGQDCSKECSHNCVDNNCNSQNGSCVHGCKPGYDYTMSTNCLVACEDGNYGTNCIMTCGVCFPNTICDKASGICPNGCMIGFKGTTCSEHEKGERRFTASEVAGVAGGSVGSCLLFLGLVFASVLGYRRYKSASSKTDSTNVISDVENTNTGRAYEGPYEMSLKNNDEHIYQKI
ncbi:protein draper-like [Mya arenaria]|uniref:protein draper-like n=1 Tax=Mya arenaria TaxID=6604 RepID=UPI0022E4CC3A|nr:protein draper-like [Mya arenaria]